MDCVYNTGSTRGNIIVKTLDTRHCRRRKRMQQDKMVDTSSSIDRKIKENENINKKFYYN